MIAEGEGYEKLQEIAHKGLKGLNIAPFYGCQILRPLKLMGFEDPDKPWSLEAIIEACGGEAIDYPAKIKCCGFPIYQAREETALAELIHDPTGDGGRRRRDGDAVPALPSLAGRVAAEARKEMGQKFGMPILHLSQLVGVAAGIDESELKFKRHVVPVSQCSRRPRCS